MPAAQALADAFTTIGEDERARHQAVLDYWLSIRGSRELPPLRDLDPLEISDAASSSVLMELIGGGEDADIRHIGEALKAGGDFDKMSAAPRPSVLATIGRKLSIVAISRNFLAFEDEFSAGDETTRCWITMLPLSSAGAWVDYIYAFVSFETLEGAKPVAKEAPVPEPEVISAAEEEVPAEEDVLELDSPMEAVEEAVETQDLEETIETPVEPVAQVEEPVAKQPEEARPAKKGASFSFESSGGFYAKAVKVQPTLPAAPAKDKAAPAKEETSPPPVAEDQAEFPAEVTPVAPVAEEAVEAPVEDVVAEASPDIAEEESQPAAQEKPLKSTPAPEGTLQSKLTEVRAKADEARAAKLRANVALYEGLGAAYDFALDAESSPEEYLKLVEAKGLKIQLRSPMRPVVKLAFDGMCDDSTIAQLEAVLGWALEQELPRGSLAKCIEEAGGIGPILNGQAKAA